MNKRYSQFTVPNSLKWIIGVICLVIISCFIYSVYLYNDIQQNKTESFDRVKAEVLQETKLNKIVKIERFHGKDAYYVLQGVTKDNKQKIVFYPFDKSAKLTIVSQSEIVSEEKIRNNWSNQCKNCELIKITPAIVGSDKVPAWELTYIDESNRYIMDYLSIYSGKRIELIGFKQMFN